MQMDTIALNIREVEERLLRVFQSAQAELSSATEESRPVAFRNYLYALERFNDLVQYGTLPDEMQ